MSSEKEKKKIVVALLGNPNTGKSTLFNLLTKETESTGNWPGVTVQKKIGFFSHKGCDIEIVDLPGIYNISMLEDISQDQMAVSYYLVNEKYDIVLNVLDASNAERNLYLTCQCLDINKPMVVALNFSDLMDKEDAKLLEDIVSQQVGVDTITISSKKNTGIDKLKDALISKNRTIGKITQYPPIVKNCIESLSKYVPHAELRHWLAVKLLEEGRIRDIHLGNHVYNRATELQQFVYQTYLEDSDILMASSRFEYIKNILTSHPHEEPAAVHAPADHKVKPVIKRKVDRKSKFVEHKESKSQDWLDQIALGSFTGLPVFLFIMLAMFTFSITVGGILQDTFELFARAIFIDFASWFLRFVNSPEFLITLISSGVGGGVVTVLSFVPVIGGLYFFLSFLEDTGYLSRAAVLMDGLLRKIGLPGKAFIPLIVSFGCNVPAIVATRTLDSMEARIKTVMMAPFMSCSARLTVYALFCSAFFKEGAALLVFCLYCLGVLAAIGTGLLLNKVIAPSNKQYLVLELPKYQMPSFATVWKKTRGRIQGFVMGAGKLIVGIFIVVQLLASTSANWEFNKSGFAQDSIIHSVGKASTFVFKPMGMQEEHWPLVVSLFTGILAKEVVIGTLSAVYNHEPIFDRPHPPTIGDIFSTMGDGMRALVGNIANFSLFGNFTELAQYEFKNELEESAANNRSLVEGLRKSVSDKAAIIAYLIFVLLYFPCISVFAAIKSEINIKWAIYSVTWSTVLAYTVATLFYQLSSHLF